MSENNPDATVDSARDRERDLAQERARLEAAGKNWEARHVADLIGLSVLTVKRMARKGTLPAIKVGRVWEFPPAKVRAWYSGEPWEVSPTSRPPAKPRKKTRKRKKR